MLTCNKTLLFEGAHCVGKSTAVDLICKRTGYAHTLIDRGWASNYAFAKLYGRPGMDLDRAIHDYFANSTAYLVYLKLWAEDYQADFVSEAFDRARWVGTTTEAEDNALLDRRIAEAVERACQLGYGSRVLICMARASEPERQANQILSFIS